MSLVRHLEDIPADVLAVLRRGTVIPAHLLALDANRRLDSRRQRALTRYYLDAGAGGIAVGVHATQFAIRDAGLYEPVLRLATETVREWAGRPIVLVAGLAGGTAQARREAEIARELGYHAGMLSLGAMRGAAEDELVTHCLAVSRVMPLVGFYLQPAVGGIELGAGFWRRLAEIENVVAVKIAPFNRYRTLDVVKGVVAARAEDRVTLYTGNDDHIVGDLVTPFVVQRSGESVTVRIKGGLLGHWSVWTRSAVRVAGDATCGGRAGRARAGAPRARRESHRRQQRLFRRRERLSGVHRRLPRGAAAPGAVSRQVVSRPGRGSLAGPGRRDRARDGGLRRVRRHAVRADEPRALAGLTEDGRRRRAADAALAAELRDQKADESEEEND